MDIRKLQRAIVDGLEDVKGQHIVVFNTEALSPLFERVIIASGTSNRQTKALASSVRDAVKAIGEPTPRMEGEENGEWIIVDCGAAVAHIMQPAFREYYRLEEIWGIKPVSLKAAVQKVKDAAKAGASAGKASSAEGAAKAPRKTAAKTAAKTAGKTAPKPASKSTASKPAGKAAAPRRATTRSAPASGTTRTARGSAQGTDSAAPRTARKTATKSAGGASAPKRSTTSGTVKTPARSAAGKSAPRKTAATKTPRRTGGTGTARPARKTSGNAR